MKARQRYDVAVIGAGVFGAWTAYHLARAGRRVFLADAYGPGHARASSGGETRIIRLGYGAAELYTRWAARSLALWQEFEERAGQTLFHRTGVLSLARAGDPLARATRETLAGVGARFEELEAPELARRYPQMRCDPDDRAIYEPESGAILARRAVQAVVRAAVGEGAEYLAAAVAPPAGEGRLEAVRAGSGAELRAGDFVFACGPWLPKIFPELLGGRIRPTRQEVFFFGAPAGDRRFAPPALPAWIDFGAEIYGVPDLEERGFKIGLDRHGPAFDPDAGERLVTAGPLAEVRGYLARRFPDLAGAPLVEARVCQYENTSNGDFLIDRHPAWENVWLLGGGSGHGFKHGPALGEYAAARLTGGGEVDPRFRLASKKTVPERAVF